MKQPNFRGDEPGVNWLIHVLTENVGKNEWVPKTPEEQAVYDKEFPHDKGYPYKVLTHPIPEGTVMRFECSKPYVIACDNLDIREYLIGIAERLKWFKDEYYRLNQDAAPWYPASEHPDGLHSSHRCRSVQVDSGPLRYLGSFFVGYHDNRVNRWYVFIAGKPVEHEVEQWRALPRAPGEAAEYESVKTEVSRLRTIRIEQNRAMIDQIRSANNRQEQSHDR